MWSNDLRGKGKHGTTRNNTARARFVIRRSPVRVREAAPDKGPVATCDRPFFLQAVEGGGGMKFLRALQETYGEQPDFRTVPLKLPWGRRLPVKYKKVKYPSPPDRSFLPEEKGTESETMLPTGRFHRPGRIRQSSFRGSIGLKSRWAIHSGRLNRRMWLSTRHRLR